MLHDNKPTIIANWKMNPSNYEDTINLFNLYYQNLDLSKINLIVAPPTIYLLALSKLLNQLLKTNDINNNDINYQFKLNSKSIYLSIQNICWGSVGAFTGETSVEMVKDLGIRFAILGHSECRTNYQETEEIIAKKIMLALQAKIMPIVCIGETQEQLLKGDKVIQGFIRQQVFTILKQVNNLYEKDKINIERIFIAYEPCWAIGKKSEINIDYIYKQINYIKETIEILSIKNFNKLNKMNAINNKNHQGIKFHLLYGGSVNPINAKNILQITDLDGILVGGASLEFEQFSQIVKQV